MLYNKIIAHWSLWPNNEQNAFSWQVCGDSNSN